MLIKVSAAVASIFERDSKIAFRHSLADSNCSQLVVGKLGHIILTQTHAHTTALPAGLAVVGCPGAGAKARH